MRQIITSLIALTLLAGCTEPVPVVDSREILWQRYAHHSIDEILLAWGTPGGETHLTDGSRLITYRRTTIYNADSPYERVSGCEVSFLAKPPAFTIENISMEGSSNECGQLAQGQTGMQRYVYNPPPTPYYGAGYRYPHRSYPF